MFAEDGKIEDPIGKSYLDETGEGHNTPEAREALWENNIAKYLSINDQNSQDISIGKLGGGEDNLQAITVTTYDSAYLRASSIGNQFKLIIFDEVHHLPASGYRSIAEQFISPCRLGLTATIEREDELHELIPYLIGGVVFRLGSQELSDQKHLAEYIIDRIAAAAPPSEWPVTRILYPDINFGLRSSYTASASL